MKELHTIYRKPIRFALLDIISIQRVELLIASFSQTNCLPILACEIGSDVCYKAVLVFSKS